MPATSSLCAQLAGRLGASCAGETPAMMKQSAASGKIFNRAFKLSAFRPFHLRALQFTVGIALFDVVALVELLLALAHAEGNFHLAVLPVKRQREQRIA